MSQPQAVGRQRAAGAHVNDRPLLRALQRAVVQRHRQQLVGPQAGVITCRAINDVVAVAQGIVPEAAKTGLHPFR